MKYPKYKLAFPSKKVIIFNGHPMTQFDGYTLNTYASGNGIVSASKAKGFWGESAELFQSAANYHSFEGYSANKGTISGNIYIFGKGNDVVTAFFPEMSVYNLYITQTPGGTISAVPMSGHYGEIITLYNTPSSHYSFNGYSVTGATITGNQLTIGNSDISIQANWVEDSKYNLTIQQVSGGRVTSNKSTGYQGDQVTLSNTPSSHYTFGSYSITGATLTGNKFNFGSQNVTAKGSFVEDPIRSVSLSQQTGGRISATPMSGYDGTQVVLTNSVSSDYLFSAYDVTGATLTGNRFILTGSNATAKGIFQYHPVRNVILQQVSGGRIFSDKSTGYDGDIVVFTYTPSSNYDFNGFSITGSILSGNSAMINNGNITAKGNFAIHEDFDSVDICNQTWMKYNLNVDDGLGGVVKTHSGYGGYDFGEQYFYTPEAAYRIGNSIRGWRVPTWGDVSALRSCAGGTSAGKNLKSTFGWFNQNNVYHPPGNGVDAYGFRALPVGNYVYDVVSNSSYLRNVGCSTDFICGPSSNQTSGRWWTFEGNSDQMGVVDNGFKYSSLRLIKKTKYNITLNQTPGGVIVSNALTGYSDDIITLSSQALPGWEFVNYSITGATLTGNKFKMQELNVTAKANFQEAAPSVYNLTLQTNGHGRLSASKTTGYYNDTVTLESTPSAGYSFSGYTVTGGTISNSQFTFSANNATAKAWFSEDPYNPLHLPAYTMRVRTSDGNAPVGDYARATRVAGTTNVFDVYNNTNDWYRTFYNSTTLIEVLGANTTNVTSFERTFEGSNKLSSVALFDTSKVKNMEGMFAICNNLSSTPLYDTSNVTNMASMFHGDKLTAIPLFNTSKVTNMYRTFYGCRYVNSGSLALYRQASTQTNPPSNHSETFKYCGSLTTNGRAELEQIPSDWK